MDININSLTLSLQTYLRIVLNNDFKNGTAEEKKLINQLSNIAKLNSDAAKFKNTLGLMSPSQSKEAVNRLYQRERTIGDIIKADVFEWLEDSVVHNSYLLDLRLANIQNIAIASGGESDKINYGLWGAPFWAEGHQKLTSGTKYGRYIFADNWLSEMMVSYGRTRVNNLEKRLACVGVNCTTLEDVISKYRVIYYDGKILVGREYDIFNQYRVIPTLRTLVMMRLAQVTKTYQ